MEHDPTNIEWCRQDCHEHGCEMILDAQIGQTVYVAAFHLRYRNGSLVIPIVVPYRTYIKNAGTTINTPMLRTEKGFNISWNDVMEEDRLPKWDYPIPDTIPVEIIK